MRIHLASQLAPDAVEPMNGMRAQNQVLRFGKQWSGVLGFQQLIICISGRLLFLAFLANMCCSCIPPEKSSVVAQNFPSVYSCM